MSGWRVRGAHAAASSVDAVLSYRLSCHSGQPSSSPRAVRPAAESSDGLVGKRRKGLGSRRRPRSIGRQLGAAGSSASIGSPSPDTGLELLGRANVDEHDVAVAQPARSSPDAYVVAELRARRAPSASRAPEASPIASQRRAVPASAEVFVRSRSTGRWRERARRRCAAPAAIRSSSPSRRRAGKRLAHERDRLEQRVS